MLSRPTQTFMEPHGKAGRPEPRPLTFRRIGIQRAAGKACATGQTLKRSLEWPLQLY